MGIFDNVFSPENVAAREEVERNRASEEARKTRERTENAAPALQYFLELHAEAMGKSFARGESHYSLSFASNEPISRKVRERFGEGVFAIDADEVLRLLHEEGFTYERVPMRGYWIRPKPRQ